MHAFLHCFSPQEFDLNRIMNIRSGDVPTTASEMNSPDQLTCQAHNGARFPLYRKLNTFGNLHKPCYVAILIHE